METKKIDRIIPNPETKNGDNKKTKNRSNTKQRKRNVVKTKRWMKSL